MNESHNAPESRPRENAIALVFVALFLAISLPPALFSDLWIDEYYSLHTTRGGLTNTIIKSYETEFLPPAYFSLLWLWRLAGDSVPYLRTLSVIIAACALWVAYRASRRWCPEVPAWVVMLPLSTNLHFVYAATEIRPYCLNLLVCSSLLLLLHRGFLGEKRSLRDEVGYLAASIIAVYTYYHLGFILVAGAAVLLARSRWRELLRYLGYMVVVAIVMLPEIPMVRTGMDTLVQTVDSFVSPWDAFRKSVQMVLALPFAMYSFHAAFRWVFMLGLLGVCAIGLWLGRRNLGRTQWSLAVIMSVLIVGFTGMSILNGQSMVSRHFSFAVVPLWFSFAALLALDTRTRTRVLPAVAVIATVLSGLAIYWSFYGFSKDGDYRRAAAHLVTHEKPNQPILVLKSECEGPLAYYYNGVNELVPFPSPVNYDEYKPLTWRIESKDEVAARFANATGTSESFWVYTDHRPGESVTWLDMDLNYGIFESYIDEHADRVGEAIYFPSSTLRLFRTKTSHE